MKSVACAKTIIVLIEAFSVEQTLEGSQRKSFLSDDQTHSLTYK